MTDNEIIKALECCYGDINEQCEECPNRKTCCDIDVIEITVDLINRQKEKIEELRKGFKADADYFASEYDSYIRAEAIKELEKMLYERSDIIFGDRAVRVRDINTLAKELTDQRKAVRGNETYKV